jgi:hypothetical protein
MERLAAGRPLRAMMISRSSPCSIASIKRDRLDFACNMLTQCMV